MRCNFSKWMINTVMCATSAFLRCKNGNRCKIEKGAEKHHLARFTLTRQLIFPVKNEGAAGNQNLLLIRWFLVGYAVQGCEEP